MIQHPSDIKSICPASLLVLNQKTDGSRNVSILILYGYEFSGMPQFPEYCLVYECTVIVVKGKVVLVLNQVPYHEVISSA
jgi:hypothetical protein